MAALLQVADLHAAYGPTRVLHGISFELEEGSITALLGANGAGKTTTLRALCGMVKTEGEVRYAGERIDGKATEDIVQLKGWAPTFFSTSPRPSSRRKPSARPMTSTGSRFTT